MFASICVTTAQSGNEWLQHNGSYKFCGRNWKYVSDTQCSHESEFYLNFCTLQRFVFCCTLELSLVILLRTLGEILQAFLISWCVVATYTLYAYIYSYIYLYICIYSQRSVFAMHVREVCSKYVKLQRQMKVSSILALTLVFRRKETSAKQTIHIELSFLCMLLNSLMSVFLLRWSSFASEKCPQHERPTTHTHVYLSCLRQENPIMISCVEGWKNECINVLRRNWGGTYLRTVCQSKQWASAAEQKNTAKIAKSIVYFKSCWRHYCA